MKADESIIIVVAESHQILLQDSSYALFLEKFFY